MKNKIENNILVEIKKLDKKNELICFVISYNDAIVFFYCFETTWSDIVKILRIVRINSIVMQMAHNKL